MREISSQGEPNSLAQWRSQYQNDINYGYNLIGAELREEVLHSLVAEQRGLCAYTGIGVTVGSSHIEHLRPQAHCLNGEDVAYKNLVACYPNPNSPYVPFGALPKADWPPPEEQHLFVSPRSTGCEQRFKFNLRGQIAATSNSDSAAIETIKRLKLDNVRLEGLRKEAIDATLQLHGKVLRLLDLQAARRRLASLINSETSGRSLEPFCFALKQALRKHIERLESIRKSKRRG